MTENQNSGGFAGDPTAALTVSGSTGCCGNPPQSTNIALPDPAEAAASCCGTPAVAETTGTCCAPAAKSESVASGTGCCE